MSFNNIIAIIGDKFDAINVITSKLVLLRDLDKIVDTNLENAVEFLCQTMPNVIILHAKGDSEESIKALKDIKENELLRNIPVLLYSEECTKEFLIDAFDLGISDIIKTPIADWELLIRVIWCIQKNEITINTDSRNNFLTNLGIIEDKTGFYTEEYAEQLLNAEIDSAIKYKNPSCLMLVGPDDKFFVQKSALLNGIIKKSVRLNDSVGIRKDGKYYIYLPKTKLNGAYAVFERINNNLGFDFNVNAAVAEIDDKNFREVKDMLDSTYLKTKGQSNVLLTTNALNVEETETEPENREDIIERRIHIKENRNTEGLFTKPDGGSDFTKDTLFNIETNNENISQVQPAAKTPVTTVATRAVTPKVSEKVNGLFLQKRLNPNLPDVEIGEFSEEEERNAILFRQAFKKKCELVTTPVFDKFKLQVENKRKMIDVNKSVDFNQSFFELRKNDKLMRLTVNYPGFSKVDIITEIFFGSEKKGYNAFSLNLTEYSFHKLSITLEGLIQEYETYI